MGKNYILMCLFLLIGCASAEVKQKSIDNKTDYEKVSAAAGKKEIAKKDIAETIVETILNNIYKLPDKRVAVVNFTDINGKESEQGKLLAERITTKLSLNTDIKVIERKQLDKIIDEQKFNMAGFTTDTEQELGTILDVDAIISGTIAYLNEYDEVNARMIDVRTGEIYCAVNAKGRLRSVKNTGPLFSKRDGLNEYPIRGSERNRKMMDHEPKQRELHDIMEAHKRELNYLKHNKPVVYKNAVRVIEAIERIRKEKPRMFLLITEPRDSEIIREKRRERPWIMKRVIELRKKLKQIIEHSPPYRNKLMIERRIILDRFREERFPQKIK